jgi:2-keto-4-pentenoate hydratase/2-oxohepta-3-ene-1,7-dioic acid hydratase in catechol pathway
MEHWIRFTQGGKPAFGTLHGGRIAIYTGDMYANPSPTSESVALAAVTVLTPTLPSKMICLWNNFHERAIKEKLNRPPHPLYFLKASNAFAAQGEPIRRPGGYAGNVVFEGELGVVIGKRCTAVSAAESDGCIFGYTCVNDVTARDILHSDASFAQWTRAKSFDTFGIFGPVIARGIDPAALRVRTLLNGVEKQNYPVSDMFFTPQQLVSLISHDMTLYPGDVIACATSVGAGPMAAGETVTIAIDGVGELSNIMQ